MHAWRKRQLQLPATVCDRVGRTIVDTHTIDDPLLSRLRNAEHDVRLRVHFHLHVQSIAVDDHRRHHRFDAIGMALRRLAETFLELAEHRRIRRLSVRARCEAGCKQGEQQTCRSARPPRRQSPVGRDSISELRYRQKQGGGSKHAENAPQRQQQWRDDRQADGLLLVDRSAPPQLISEIRPVRNTGAGLQRRVGSVALEALGPGDRRDRQLHGRWRRAYRRPTDECPLLHGGCIQRDFRGSVGISACGFVHRTDAIHLAVPALHQLRMQSEPILLHAKGNQHDAERDERNELIAPHPGTQPTLRHEAQQSDCDEQIDP